MEKFYALFILLITLLLVIVRPKGLGIGYSALMGASVCFLLGLVRVQDIIYITHLVGDATITFVLLVFISIILDKAGFFEWSAVQAIKFARGNGLLLFLYIIILGGLCIRSFCQRRSYPHADTYNILKGKVSTPSL